MKKNIIFALLILFSACSQKQKSKNHFKLTLGNMALATNASTFVNAVEVTSKKFNIIKLDSTNSANINFGTYQLVLVTFEGPEANSGEMRCGSVDTAIINSPESTFNITVTKVECELPKYADTIIELKKGIVSKWDTDQFDRSFWGP